MSEDTAPKKLFTTYIEFKVHNLNVPTDFGDGHDHADFDHWLASVLPPSGAAGNFLLNIRGADEEQVKAIAQAFWGESKYINTVVVGTADGGAYKAFFEQDMSMQVFEVGKELAADAFIDPPVKTEAETEVATQE